MFRCVPYWYNGGGGTMNMFSNPFKCLDVFSIDIMVVKTINMFSNQFKCLDGFSIDIMVVEEK